MGRKFAAPPIIARGGGSIISTSSISALAGVSGIAGYTAAKAGVIGPRRTPRRSSGRARACVNCICSAVIMTPITDVMFDEDFDHEQYRARSIMPQPIPTSGESTHIANAALWLASDKSAFVTGQIFAVDGGASTRSWLNAAPATALASPRLGARLSRRLKGISGVVGSTSNPQRG
ncbi:SDR family oxidoreductase [Sphingomonas sp.]|uniref:SDR family oxidoreductase n=1 Tax=Sphingomonas sp. TaxID=28214 RepID=UPI003AFF8529